MMEVEVDDLVDLEANPEPIEENNEQVPNDEKKIPETTVEEETENILDENIPEDDDVKTVTDPEVTPDPDDTEAPTDDNEASGLLAVANTNEEEEDKEEREIPQVVTVYHATEVVGKRALKARDDEDFIMEEITKPKMQTMDWLAMIGKFFFSHIGLMILSMVYANIGANIYIGIELPGEELRYEIKKNTARDIEDRMRYMAYAYWTYHNSKTLENRYNETAFKDRVESDVRSFFDVILKGIDEDGYDGAIDGWDYDWTYAKSLLFTITIMTTVGYGHISPKTFEGRLFTIPYSMVGIAIMMVFMARIGDAMADILKTLYSRFCCRPCRSKRRVNEYPPGFSLLKAHKTLAFDDVGDENWMATDTVIIPITINILVILGFVCIGTGIFHKWEGWDMGSATYFSFITLTTIGFGDMVPEKSFEVEKGDIGSFIKMSIACTYCVLGMSLLAMCISLIQEGFTIKAENMAKKMGMGKKGVVSLDVITVKNKRADLAVDEDEKYEDIVSTPDVVVVPIVSPPQTRPVTAATVASVPGAIEDDDDMDEEEEEMGGEDEMGDNDDEMDDKNDEDNLIEEELEDMDDDMD